VEVVLPQRTPQQHQGNAVPGAALFPDLGGELARGMEFRDFVRMGPGRQALAATEQMVARGFEPLHLRGQVRTGGRRPAKALQKRPEPPQFGPVESVGGHRLPRGGHMEEKPGNRSSAPISTARRMGSQVVAKTMARISGAVQRRIRRQTGRPPRSPARPAASAAREPSHAPRSIPAE
jgi:hypothetical protein